ncbi:acyl-CoA dehydrogenase family protein [Streptomyces sp. AP-93]|uniref:acyl-CoA dehydrogenase family protein n=1 Tax=Streptomyces sp. AP-93 TaxID=2929048 RepID=UPI001FAFBFE8|nr:acyl-CoA dehydrogenase family protein [Streptomyces sp. AP-93]MCJ0873078.1 acyl-CoA/acyl-ACP dehydrogenase [Streptomyces sp. AP-93]
MNSGNPGDSRSSTSEFLESFDAGRLLWSTLGEFPKQDPENRSVGDRIVQEVGEFLASTLDPEEVDRTGRLPDGFIAALQERGLLRLRAEPELGGLGLSEYNAFRVIECAAAWSVPAGQILGIQAGVGAGAMIPAMPEGELRDFVRRRIAEGMISGFGDTDESGQNNAFPSMTATLTEDGSAYLLRGRKLFTGHGTVADLLGVSATLTEAGRRRVGAFFVDTRDAPGFQVSATLDYLGSRGLPNGELVFDDVRVPREHALLDSTGDQLPPLVGLLALTGRVYFTGAPALAIARNCLIWSREFLARRAIDGRELASYDSVQRIVATTVADVYAMDSVARWSLTGRGPQDRLFERFVAKNVLTTTAWRVVDRTMSLLAAEGFETVDSKARRGGPVIPLERAFRDARGLRVAGNIDFRLDEQAGQLLLKRHYAGQAKDCTPDGELTPEADPRLSRSNQEHLKHLGRTLVELGRLCASLTQACPDPEELFSRQHTVLAIGRIATELFTVCAVLSRAADTAGTDAGVSQDIADVHSTQAWHRIATHWRELHAFSEPDYTKVSDSWLAGTASVDLNSH